MKRQLSDLEKGKLGEIYKQFVKKEIFEMALAIKLYGLGKFHEDFYVWIEDSACPNEEYSELVYNFHVMNRRIRHLEGEGVEVTQESQLALLDMDE